MGAYNDRRRNLKRAYRKKALQTNMSQISESVDATPLPVHSYSTPTTQESQVVRPAQDPRTYSREVRPAVEQLDFTRQLDGSRFPWHLAPKADSANVISRTAYDFATSTLADNNYVDILVLNIADTAGSQSTGTTGTAAADRGATPTQTTETKNIPAGAETGIGNPEHPGGGGASVAGVSGTIRKAGTGEIYRMQTFGHSEVTNSNISGSNPINAANPIIYQIWVDGELFMEWSNFQWSPVSPQQSQWTFQQPLTVTQQLVFRIINHSSATLNTGEVDAVFSGWSEQLSGYVDVAYQQLENN